MAAERKLWLNGVSVVVTAEHHNPSILNPDFLVSREIVPDTWCVAETITSPAGSVVKYANGVALTVDPSRLMVTEACGPEFGDDFKSHDLVTAYLKTLPHVPYRDLGLNCNLYALQSDPQRWLVERFAAKWLREEPQFRGIRPTFVLDAKDAVCNVKLAEGERNGDPCVVADCNMHHKGPLEVASLLAAISHWRERQEFMDAAVGRLFESQST